MNFEAKPGVDKGSALTATLPRAAAEPTRRIQLAAAVIVALGWGALLVLFRDTAWATVQTWYASETFNHGFLILPIAGYLVWLRRKRLLRLAPAPIPAALPLMLLPGVVWLLGELASTLVVQQLALVVMLQAFVFCVMGRRITWLLAYPLVFMLFAVPAGSFLIPPMQNLTAEFTVAGLRLIGIPVYLDGVFISIPTGNFEVAEACSGVRFLIAMLALGFFFADITYAALWRRAVFIALAVVVPIIANGFRALGIVLLAYATDNTLAVGVDHIVYGWVFFTLVTFVLLAIGMTFRDRDPHAADSVASGRVPPAASAATIGAVATAAAILAATAPSYAALARAVGPKALAAPLGAPAAGGGWRPAPTTERWSPHFAGATAELRRSYVKDGKRVELYIALYLRQTQGAEVISHRNDVDGGWARASSGSFPVSLEGRKVRVETLRLLSGRGGRLVWRWNWVDHTMVGNPYATKLLQAKGLLTGGGSAGAAIVLAADYHDRPGEAAATLKDFLANAEPISTVLRRAVSGR